MRILFNSDHGDSWFLARRLLREGHDVSMHIYDPPSRAVGDGLIPKRPTSMVSEGTDLVLFDGTGHGREGQALRRRGIGVIGGNPLDHDLEVDRTKGTALMRAAGIKTPETHSFTSLAQGQAFLATHPGRWYFKPSGDVTTDLTRNGEAKAVRRFLAWAATSGSGLRGFELQRAVDGAEVSVEGWFDGKDWVGPFNSTLETKKFCVGDLGARAGCQANVVWAYADENPPLVEQTLRRMTPVLRAAHYQGPLDINLVVDDDGTPKGLEWTARFGFDALQAYSLLLQGNCGQQLNNFARGRLRHWDCRQDQLGLTLRLSTLPYPYDEYARDLRGLPLDSALFDKPETTFLDDVMVGKDGLAALAGRDGSVGCVGVLGRDWPTMCRKVLERADALDIPSKAYRTDVIPDAEERWQHLTDCGYLQAGDVPGMRGRVSPLPDSRSLKGPGIGNDRTAPDEAATPGEDDAPMPPFVHDIADGQA